MSMKLPFQLKKKILSGPSYSNWSSWLSHIRLGNKLFTLPCSLPSLLKLPQFSKWGPSQVEGFRFGFV